MENQGSIKFKTNLLATFALIDAPGKYKLQVLNDVTEKNLYTDESGSRYIVNLRAISLEKKAEVLETFQGKSEVEIEETNGLFMTGSIWKNRNNNPALPMKGEFCNCLVGFVASRTEGDVDPVDVLRITHIQVEAAKTANAFSIESELAAAATVPAGELEHV